MWPMLITSFFLLIFLQPIPFFRLLFSFFSENHALLIFAFSSADMSFSYLYTSSASKNTISIITKKPVKSRKITYFLTFSYEKKVIHILLIHIYNILWIFKIHTQFVDNSWITSLFYLHFFHIISTFIFSLIKNTIFVII